MSIGCCQAGELHPSLHEGPASLMETKYLISTTSSILLIIFFKELLEK